MAEAHVVTREHRFATAVLPQSVAKVLRRGDAYQVVLRDNSSSAWSPRRNRYGSSVVTGAGVARYWMAPDGLVHLSFIAVNGPVLHEVGELPEPEPKMLRGTLIGILSIAAGSVLAVSYEPIRSVSPGGVGAAGAALGFLFFRAGLKLVRTLRHSTERSRHDTI